MNRQYAEKIISALKDDLENDYKGFELADDMSHAEKLFGRDISAICDCVEEAKRHSGTIRSNAQTIIDLLEMDLLEQVGTSMTQVERGLFIKLFNRGGYVLNFSTNDFDTFTMESVGVAVCSKYKMSKGRSLLAYIEGAKNSETDKLLHDLFDYYETHYESEYTKDFHQTMRCHSPTHSIHHIMRITVGSMLNAKKLQDEYFPIDRFRLLPSQIISKSSFQAST